MFDAKKYGPWAVIVGASEGVGVSFARKLGKAGINIVLIARQEPMLQQAAKQVHDESGVQTRVLALDVTVPDMLERVRAATDDVEVGLIVYNAGASSHEPGSFLRTALDDAMNLLKLNPVCQMALSYHFGKKMAERGRGGIISIGSLAANAGSPTIAPYCAAKAFTQIFAEGLWAELKPLGIDVLYIALGATDTPARERLTRNGTMKNPPGTIISSSDEIAEQCMDNIDNGPVIVVPHLEEFFRQLGTMSRREAVEAATRNIMKHHEP